MCVCVCAHVSVYTLVLQGLEALLTIRAKVVHKNNFLYQVRRTSHQYTEKNNRDKCTIIKLRFYKVPSTALLRKEIVWYKEEYIYIHMYIYIYIYTGAFQ